MGLWQYFWDRRCAKGKHPSGSVRASFRSKDAGGVVPIHYRCVNCNEEWVKFSPVNNIER